MFFRLLFVHIFVFLWIHKERSHFMEKKTHLSTEKSYFFAVEAEKLDVGMEDYMLFHSQM